MNLGGNYNYGGFDNSSNFNSSQQYNSNYGGTGGGYMPSPGNLDSTDSPKKVLITFTKDTNVDRLALERLM